MDILPSRMWENDHEKGNVVWVIPPGGDMYEKATIKEFLADGSVLVSLHSSIAGGEQAGRLCQVEKVYPINEETASDMTSLAHINEPAVLQNLMERSYQDEPYTFIGPVLCIVNPLKRIPLPTEISAAMQKIANQQVERSKKKNRTVSDSWPRIPHPYTLAETCYQNMLFALSQHRAIYDEKQRNSDMKHDEFQADVVDDNSKSLYVDQSVVVGGESGAGKTEASKLILSHLLDRCSGKRKLHNRLAKSSLLLEVFGNAKTLRNSNSSRFAKFLKLHFDETGATTTGASVETFLLERSRLCHQEPGEQSFHIFYLLLSAWSEGEYDPKLARDAHSPSYSSVDSSKALLSGSAPNIPEFDYLMANGYDGPSSATVKNSPLITRKGTLNRSPSSMSNATLSSWYSQELSSRFTMKQIRETMDTFGFRKSQQEDMFQILLGILFLGNVQFIDDERREGHVAVLRYPRAKATSDTQSSFLNTGGGSPQEALQQAAHLLGLDKDALLSAMCHKKVQVGREITTSFQNAIDATHARDALAKALYVRLFAWVLYKLNKAVGASAELDEISQGFIGVLDIFGFESLVHNDFEQLLINYTNEVLQVTFNQQIFMAELNLFMREGLFESMPVQMSGELKASMRGFHQNLDCLWLLQGPARQHSKHKKLKKKKEPPNSLGILGIIDQESQMPRASDKSMLKRLRQAYGDSNSPSKKAPVKLRPPGSNCFGKVHPKHQNSQFVVEHYAGGVAYSVGNFIKKNRDHVPAVVEELIADTSLGFLSKLWDQSWALGQEPDGASQVGSSKASQLSHLGSMSSFMLSSNGNSRQKETSISKFRKQIDLLLDTLQNTRCSFVRCIKPSPQVARRVDNPRLRSPSSWSATSVASWFSRKYVLLQLRSLNVLQSVRVLQRGFPARVDYATLTQLFGQWLGAGAIGSGHAARVKVAALLTTMGVPREDYKLGNTMVFFRNGKLAAINRLLGSPAAWASAARKGNPSGLTPEAVDREIQRYLVRRKWRVALAAVLAGRVFLGMLKELRKEATQKGAEMIQRRWRRYHETLLSLVDAGAPQLPLRRSSDDSSMGESVDRNSEAEKTRGVDEESSLHESSEKDRDSESRESRGKDRDSESRESRGKDRDSESRESRGKGRDSESRESGGKDRNSESRESGGKDRNSESRKSKGKDRTSESRKSRGKDRNSESRKSKGKDRTSESRKSKGKHKNSERRELSGDEESPTHDVNSVLSSGSGLGQVRPWLGKRVSSRGGSGPVGQQSVDGSERSLTNVQKEEWNIAQLMTETLEGRDGDGPDEQPKDTAVSAPSDPHAFLESYDQKRLSIRSGTSAASVSPSARRSLLRGKRLSGTSANRPAPTLDLRNDIVCWAWKLSVRSRRNWKRRLLVLNKQQRSLTYLSKASSLYGLKVKGVFIASAHESAVVEQAHYPNAKSIRRMVHAHHNGKPKESMRMTVVKVTHGLVKKSASGKPSKKKHDLFLAFDNDEELVEFTKGMNDAVKGFSVSQQRTAWRGAHIRFDPHTPGSNTWETRSNLSVSSLGSSLSSQQTAPAFPIAGSIKGTVATVTNYRRGPRTDMLRVETGESSGGSSFTWGGDLSGVGLDSGSPWVPTGQEVLPKPALGVSYDEETIDSLLRQLKSDLIAGKLDDEVFETQTEYLLQAKERIAMGAIAGDQIDEPESNYAVVMVHCVHCDNSTPTTPDGVGFCEVCGEQL